MSFLSAIGSTLASVAANKIFAPKVPKGPGFNPNQNITTPGFTLRSGNLTRGQETVDTLANLGLLGKDTSKALGGLLAQVSPGFGRLTQSRLEGLGTRETKAIGDLRANLAKRRLSGSSFGENALINAHLAFQQEEDKIRAESFLQELDLTQKLLQQNFANAQSVITQNLTQLNLEASLASNLTAQTNSLLASSQQTLQQLAAKSAAGVGSFFQPVADKFGTALSDFVGGFNKPSPTLVGNFNAGFT